MSPGYSFSLILSPGKKPCSMVSMVMAAQGILSVLNSAANLANTRLVSNITLYYVFNTNLPSLSTTMTPPEPPPLLNMYCNPSMAASCGLPPDSKLWTSLSARHTLVMDSPCPVVDTAPDSLSAYPPAPARGESPTRPGLLPVIPPVEVAQETFPPWV